MSIPSQSHVEIAQDELDGLQQLGYVIEGFAYAAKSNIKSNAGRLWVVFHHAILLILKAYRFKPDVIYFNSRLEIIAGTRDFLTILLVRLFYWKPVRFMIKSHGSDLEILEESGFWIRKVILPYLRKEVSAWLFLSGEEKKQIITNGFLSPQTIFVTQNIVRAGQFRKDRDFRSKHRIAENETILLFAGRLIPEKGVFEVIESFIQVAKRHQVILCIVGDGPEKASLERIIEDAQLKNKVIFTGFIPEPEVIPYYANADVLVFPTYFPEGFPMALFNAVAAGLSIVTTPTRAAVDYLTDPVNCLWVEARNSKSVENAIETLLMSPSERQAMAFQNIQKGKHFSRENVSAALSLIIESILPLQKI